MRARFRLVVMVTRRSYVELSCLLDHGGTELIVSAQIAVVKLHHRPVMQHLGVGVLRFEQLLQRLIARMVVGSGR